MATYYRIQPAGLGVAGHYSETSATKMDTVTDPDTGYSYEVDTHETVLADGLHVFTSPSAAIACDAGANAYGDEVVTIEAGDWWDNGDVEGVCIDGDEAKIVRRQTVEQFFEEHGS